MVPTTHNIDKTLENPKYKLHAQQYARTYDQYYDEVNYCRYGNRFFSHAHVCNGRRLVPQTNINLTQGKSITVDTVTASLAMLMFAMVGGLYPKPTSI